MNAKHKNALIVIVVLAGVGYGLWWMYKKNAAAATTTAAAPAATAATAAKTA